jgi:hypothetical protein
LMSGRGRILICYACRHHAGQCWQQLVSLFSSTPSLKMVENSFALLPCCCSSLFLISDSAKVRDSVLCITAVLWCILQFLLSGVYLLYRVFRTWLSSRPQVIGCLGTDVRLLRLW